MPERDLNPHHPSVPYEFDVGVTSNQREIDENAFMTMTLQE
jgi:hypothetical protein